MSQCSECHREATMDAPERDRCDVHWHLWFCGAESNYHSKATPRRHIRYVRQNLKESWRRYGRPEDWRSQWREVETIVNANVEAD